MVIYLTDPPKGSLLLKKHSFCPPGWRSRRLIITIALAARNSDLGRT